MSWSIFKNQTLPSSYNPFGCINGINSTCYRIPFDKCLAYCQENKRCNYGYYKSTGECYPLSTNNYADINPYDYIKDEPGDLNRVFINNSTYPRTSKSNLVHYYDTVYLKNVETQTYLQISKEDDMFVSFAPFPIELTLEYKNINTPKNLLNYNDELTVGAPSKPLILTRGLAKGLPPSFGFLNWTNLTPFSMMQIALFKFENSLGENGVVKFNENFYINILGSYVTVDDHMHAMTEYQHISTLKNQNKNITFQLLPSKNLTGYYCDNENCISIPLSETSSKDEQRFYKDKEIYRTSNCYFNCKNEFK